MASLEHTDNQDAVAEQQVTIPREAEALLEGERVYEALMVMRRLIADLQRRVRREAETKRPQRYALDFEMLSDATDSKRAFWGLMRRILTLIRKSAPDRRFVLLRGTREEILRFIHSIMSSLGLKARRYKRQEQKPIAKPSSGVLQDEDWAEIADALGSVKDLERRLNELWQILVDCSSSFKQLNVGLEEAFSEPEKKDKYFRELRDLGDSRSRPANEADAANLAVMRGLVSSKHPPVDLALVTATGALSEVSAPRSRRCDLVSPVLTFLHLMGLKHYPDPAGLLEFLYECDKELASLVHSLDMVKFGATRHALIKRRQIKEYMEIWKKALTKSNISVLNEWLRNPSSDFVDSSRLSPQKDSDRGHCEVPSVRITRTLSVARQIVAYLLGDDDPSASELLGAEWGHREEIPNGTKEVLFFKVPPCSITIEQFHEYYSIYWDADATLDDFLGSIANLQNAKLFAPERISLVGANCNEKEHDPKQLLSLDSIREIAGTDRLAMVVVESQGADIYYERAKFVESESSEFPQVRGVQVAVVSRERNVAIPARLCEATCRAYLEENDFVQMFGDKIKHCFNGVS